MKTLLLTLGLATLVSFGPLQEDTEIAARQDPAPKLIQKPQLVQKKPKHDEKGWRDDNPDLRKHWDTIEGKPAPSLEGLTGWLQTEARSWKDLRGKVVLLDTWAWWCGPCKSSMPHLLELREKHGKRGFEVLGVHSASRFDATKMRNLIGEMKLPWAFAVDRERKLSTALGNKFLPTYYVVDRAGLLRVAGANRDRIDDIVAALVSEPYEAPAAAPHDAPEIGSTWPVHTQKKLYAKNDLRGKSAPKLEVETWLTDAAKTEGKTLLIDFWATWCGPCRKAIPHMNEFQAKYAEDLVVIGISDEAAAKVQGFMKKTEMKYAQAIDTKKRMNKAVGVEGIPHVLLISSDGIVRWQGFPGDPADPLNDNVVATVVALDKKARAERKKQAEEKPEPKDGGGK